MALSPFPVLIAALTASLAVPAPQPARAGEWAQVRLVDGGSDADGRLVAGIEIVLAEGFMVYWRHPGDSGLAPEFDFSASANVADVSVDWPAPRVRHDGYGWVIGYADRVVLPLSVVPQDPSAPVDLDLALNYAVCRDICVPLSDTARVSLRGGGAGEARADIEVFRARVPATVVDGDSGTGIVSARREETADGPALRVLLRGDDVNVLVAEGPDGMRLSPAAAVRGSGGASEFLLRLGHEARRWPDNGVELRFTAIAGAFSFEQFLRVD